MTDKEARPTGCGTIWKGFAILGELGIEQQLRKEQLPTNMWQLQLASAASVVTLSFVAELAAVCLR